MQSTPPDLIEIVPVKVPDVKHFTSLLLIVTLPLPAGIMFPGSQLHCAKVFTLNEKTERMTKVNCRKIDFMRC